MKLEILDDEASAREVLAPHIRRKLVTVLRDHEDDDVEGAVWAVVYGSTKVTVRTVRAVVRECQRSHQTIGNLLDGWKPQALEKSS